MQYIKRQIEERVVELSKSWPAILLTGPRQTGKTTMLRALAEREGIGREYVSFDDPKVREMAKTDPEMFLRLHKPPVLIDEVQYAPELFTYIKIHIDEHHNPGDFWLTGSEIFPLMQGVQESLAGRVALLHMLPLSQGEISGGACEPFAANLETPVNEQTTPELFRRLWNGGMPGLVSGEAGDRNVFYSSYLSTYVERDIRDLSGTAEAMKFMRFITAVAARTAQFVYYKAIAADADIDQSTCKNWINILEQLRIVFLLYPHTNNARKRTSKTPKLYFYDTGLVCYLTKWTSPKAAEKGTMRDALIENFTASETMKDQQNTGREPYLEDAPDLDATGDDAALENDGNFSPPAKGLIRIFPSMARGQTAREIQSARQYYRRLLKRTVEVLVVVAAVAVLLATIFLPVLKVSGNSMAPTLGSGDIIVLLKTNRYQSGDICGLYWQNKLLLKRVIADSGSYVEIDKNGNVSVDGALLDEPYLTKKSLGECDIRFPYRVPDGKLFVMGDNRASSLDSRSSTVGCIDKDEVVGITLLRVWPLNELRWMH